MSEIKEKYSKFIEHRYIKSVLRRKYHLSLYELSKIISALKPVSYGLFSSYAKSFIINDNLIIHAKELKDYGCCYYIEEI